MGQTTNSIDDPKSREQLIQELSELRRKLVGQRHKHLEPSPRVNHLKSVNFDSEPPYRLLFDAMQAGFGVAEIIIDEAGKPYDYRVLEVNNAAGRLTGFAPEFIVGKTARDLVPNLNPHYIEIFGQVALSGQAEHIEVECQVLGKWFDVYVFSPKWGKFACTFIDITERKRAETALRNSETKFRNIFDNCGDSIFICDTDARILDVNQVACNRLGYTRDEMLQMTIRDIDAPESARLISAHIEATIKKNQTVFESVHRRKDGTQIHVEVNKKLVEYDGQTCILGVVRDITDRKKAQQEREKLIAQLSFEKQALAESEQRFRIMGEILPYGIWLCDADGKAVYTSQSFLDLLDMSMEEMQGFGWTHRLVPEDVEPMMKSWMHCVQTGQDWDSEHRIIDRHGDIRTVLTRGRPVRDENGRITAWAGINLDITERKKVQSALSDSIEKFHLFMDNSPTVAWMKDDQGRYVYFSQTASKRYNKKADEVIGKTDADLLPPDIAEKLKQNDQDVLSTGHATYNEDIIDPYGDGSNWLNSKFPFQDSAGNRFVAGIGIEITERKKMEMALQDSEQKFRSLFEHSPDAVILTIPDGSIESANPAACAMFDRSEQELRMIGRSGILDENDPRLSVGLQKRQQAGRVKAVELTAIRKGGEKFPIEVDTVILPVEPVRSFVIMRDITDRKHAEQALQKSEERLKKAQEISHLGSWHIDLEQNELTWSDEVYRIFGLQPQQFEATYEAFLHSVHPDDRNKVDDAYSGSIRDNLDNYEVEHRIVRPDGQIRLVHEKCEHYRDNSGKIIRSVGMVHDITERKQAEEALQRSEKRLSAILEQIPVGVGLINRQGEFILSNSVLRGYVCSMMPSADPERKKRWQSWDELGRSLPPDQWPGARALRGETVSPGIEFIYTDDGGCEVWMLISAVPFQTEDGETIGAILVIKDITERKRSERQLRQFNKTLEKQVAERTELAEARAKKLQALAVELIDSEERERRQFAHLLHDDLQQMLAAARLQLQSAPNFVNEPLLKYVGQILEDSITKTRRLSHELSPAVLHHSGLVAGLRWLSGQMNEQFGLSVILQADAAPAVENSALKLFVFRAVQELLFNTIKHAGVKQACVTLTGRDHHMVVSVSDQGRGLETKNFLNGTKKPGFGLLSIIERADYIGGSFKIDTAQGEGSRFILTVPLDAIDAYEPAKQIPSARQDSQMNMPGAVTSTIGTRVLFVDDHRVMRQGLIKLITGQPGIHMIGEAENGAEALEQARHFRPDVIIMDISMPEMDGIEATRQIKAELPNVRVLGLTMHDDDQLIGAMQQAGAEVVLKKTISAAEMVKAIYGCQ